MKNMSSTLVTAVRPLKPSLIRTASSWIIAVGFCFAPSNAYAGFACSGILDDAQRSGFSQMFSPPYSARLVRVGAAVTESNMYKQVNNDELKTLQVPTPVIVARYTLSTPRAVLLKSWLNDNASATLPGWLSTATSIVVPQAWVGLSADVFIQLINGSGDAGRLKEANLAGTVSQGGLVAMAEQVANDSSGKPKFLWIYIYQATLNGQTITTPLAVCAADVIVH
jgi:hypothetical protein